MRAALCSAFTGPEDLRVGEIEEPKPASDEILIDVHAASVSFMDQLLVSGRYQMRPSTPFVPGTEAAGVVIAVGEKVTRFQPGDRVACGSCVAFDVYPNNCVPLLLGHVGKQAIAEDTRVIH